MKIIEKIQDIYYKIPYNWRPKNIWYSITCRFWHKYTTVKPRYLSHQWTDRCEVMPHMMFEILSQFIEKECTPEQVDWTWEGNLIEVNGQKISARDEMQYLYDWWHKKYNDEYEKKSEALWDEVFDVGPKMNVSDTGILNFVFDNDEKKIEYDEKSKIARDFDEFVAKELHENLHRIINITRFL
jgi:hypothetical protein